MAKAKKRKDNRYEKKYKGKSFYGTSIEAVNKKIDEYKFNEKIGLRLDKETATIEEYAQEWLKTYCNQVEENTYRSYMGYINRFCNEIGDCRISEIYPSLIKKYFNTLVGMSNSTIKKNQFILNSMFNSAVNDGFIIRNPCAQLKTPKGTESSHRRLSEFEIRVIERSTYHHRIGRFVTFSLYSGLRRGEALALNIDTDVDFKKGIIKIDKAIKFHGNKPILTTPKTGAGVRKLPLLPTARKAIEGESGLLFSMDGEYATLSCFNRAWESYIKKGESIAKECAQEEYLEARAQGLEFYIPSFDFNIRCHDLRHTFCSMLYEKNIDIKTAQRWMGHSDTKMILKTYAHLSEKKLDDDAIKIIGGEEFPHDYIE